MDLVLRPETRSELVDAVRGYDRVLAIGAGTKDNLSRVDGVQKISLTGLSGILEYQHSEYTFTAKAGTPMSEVVAALHEKGQYLPFSPVMVEAGSTLGGAVASGLSGSGRFRYGTVRDFLLGVRYLDGMGQVISCGGKVVKNAAGFDVTKFMIGSLGRFGVLEELTFKVFPRPVFDQTLRVVCDSHEQAMERLMFAGASRWELDALDFVPMEKILYLRINGLERSTRELGKAILDTDGFNGNVMTEEDACSFWKGLEEFEWMVEGSCLAKVPLWPKALVGLMKLLDDHVGFEVRVNSGCASAWVSFGKQDEGFLDETLDELGLAGLIVKGTSERLFIGKKVKGEIYSAVKKVMDPNERYPSL